MSLKSFAYYLFYQLHTLLSIFYMHMIKISNLYTYNWIVKGKTKSSDRTKTACKTDLIENIFIL